MGLKPFCVADCVAALKRFDTKLYPLATPSYTGLFEVLSEAV